MAVSHIINPSLIANREGPLCRLGPRWQESIIFTLHEPDGSLSDHLIRRHSKSRLSQYADVGETKSQQGDVNIPQRPVSRTADWVRAWEAGGRKGKKAMEKKIDDTDRSCLRSTETVISKRLRSREIAPVKDVVGYHGAVLSSPPATLLSSLCLASSPQNTMTSDR